MNAFENVFDEDREMRILNETFFDGLLASDIVSLLSNLKGCDGVPLLEGSFGKLLKGIQADGCADGITSGSGLPINTYPFGVRGSEVFNQMMVVYRQVYDSKKGVNGLTEIICRLKKYCSTENTQYNTRAFRGEWKKDIFIFTDVWNEKFKKRMSAALRKFCDNGDVNVYFFLYTNCSVVFVPYFLNWQALNEIDRKRRVIRRNIKILV